MTTLHAHVATASRDCDSTYYRDYVAVFNDDERAEDGKLFNNFADIHFMNRVLCMVASPYACHLGMRITVDDDGIEVHENTDEGYRSASVRWCRDDCDETESSYRDMAAEAMNY